MRVRRPLSGVGFVAACVAACSGGGRVQPKPIPGELAYLPGENASWLALSGTRLYRVNGDRVYSVDVSIATSPSPEPGYADGDVCGPQGFAIRRGLFPGDVAYMAGCGLISQVNLPNGTLPNWEVELPGYANLDFLSFDLAELPGDNVVVSGIPNTSQQTTAAIFAVSGTAGILSEYKTAFWPFQMVSEGSFVFTAACNWDANALRCASPDSVVVLDYSDPTSPVEIARLPFAEDYANRAITIDGLELIAEGLPGTFDGRRPQLSWYRLSPTFDSMTLVGSGAADFDAGNPAFSRPIRRYGDHLILGTLNNADSLGPPPGSEGAPGVEVWAVDRTSGLLVLERTIRGRGPVIDVVLDTARNLAFAGGWYPEGLQVIDLGYALTGTPSWPSPP